MDYIQQRLALIDSRRAGRRLPRQVVGIAPMFLPAIGMMTGIVLQEGLSRWRDGSDSATVIWMWAILLGLSATTIWAGYIRGWWWTTDNWWLACAASVCMLCLGALRLAAFGSASPYDVRNLVGQEPRLATIRGRILTQPYQQRQNWCFAQFANTDPVTAFYLEIEQIKTPTGWHGIAGRIRVSVDEPVPTLGIGDQIQAYCWLHRFEGPTNPGQFDLRAYLKRSNVYAGASVPSREAIELRGRKGAGIVMSLRRRFSEAAAQGLLQHTSPDTQEEAMLQALLLGQRRDIDPATYEAFRKTGLAHIICLSGMHLAILVTVIWWLSRLAGLTKRGRALVCIVATGAFLLVVPPMAPIFRATVMVWVYCLAVLLRRRAGHPLNSLSLAAIVLLLIRPTQLFEAGWQLSFSAVASILAFTSRIELFLHDLAGSWLYETDQPSHLGVRLVTGVGRRAILLFSAGTAAWLGNAGVLLYHFHTITPLASVWTVLASGPVAAIVTLGFLKILLSFVLPTASMIVGLILPLLVDVFLWIVRLAARIDFSSTLIGRVPIIIILSYYGLMLFGAYVPLRRPALKTGLCAAMTLVLLFSLAVMKWQRTHRDHLILTCLDVGHGQAILAQLPGTMNVLFDAGSMYTSDVGTRIVLPFLDYIGVSRLHAIVLSHQDIDHINGVPEIVDRRWTDHVYASKTFLTQSQTSETATLLLQHLGATGVTVEPIPEMIEAGPARMTTLWPIDEAQPGIGDNDTSLVSEIEFAGRRILLCSDIEHYAQQQVVRLHPTLKADVVVAPHHGSVRTLDAGFLRQFDAAILLSSCGRLDFSQGRVVEREDRSRTLCTARDGAISICIDSDGVVQRQPTRSK
ncbi:MAG: ComEC/Rec2 family competence protein [Sedimentisphaerales bacterium]|nr:ComEC/Rec2 family competence protein [Sedimentisphaerales bacterium]